MKKVDITVIGGGINGVSIAAEAANRGLSTLLIHSHDLGSSGSAPPVTLAGTHLQHLSALDYFQLNSMLDELERLRRFAPHLIDLLPVVGPNGAPLKDKGCGLIEQYFQAMRDRTLSSLCKPAHSAKTQSIAARIKPSRLILSKALQAQAYGAEILTKHTLIAAQRQSTCWQLTLQREAQSHLEIQTTLLVNCSGWWANELLEDILRVKTRCKAKEEHRTQFFFRNPGIEVATVSVLKLQGLSKQAYYVYPVAEGIFAFGPRKCDQHGYAECVELRQGFIDTWNNAVVPHAPQAVLEPAHFIYQRKSKMALIADPCSNDETPMTTPLHDLDNPGGAAVLLNIFGVDIALHRKVARQALDILYPFTGKKINSAFKDEILPGGNFGPSSTDSDGRCIDHFIATLNTDYPNIPTPLLKRLAENYGSLATHILGNKQSVESLGQHFGHQLYQQEVDYLTTMEWANEADDILYRRTLLGLKFTPSQKDTLQRYLQKNHL